MHIIGEFMKERSESEKKERMRIRRLTKLQSARELRVEPGFQTHEHLLQIVKALPTDVEPWGKTEVGAFGDCSCGCRWYHTLAGRLGSDWGICANAASPRSGLLTFEHQGCPQFERDLRWDYLDTAAGQRARRKFEDGEEELRQWRKAHPFRKMRVTERRVGIFWLVGSKLLRDTSPLSKAERYGECLTHSNGTWTTGLTFSRQGMYRRILNMRSTREVGSCSIPRLSDSRSTPIDAS